MFTPKAQRIICLTLLAVIVAGGAFAVFAHPALAQGTTQADSAGGNIPASTSIFSFLGFSLSGLIAESLANIADWAITVMSWVVALAGAMLNFSISLTMNIKSFVDSSPAVYNTWRAIRDVSGIFIIFFLLYAAIQLILGLKRPNFNSLIKNVVMAGILVNFSFFFASLGIDASNIVSIQLYNAIAPANSLSSVSASAALDQGVVDKVLKAGGLSDIFMNSLHIQSIYRDGIAGAATGGSMSSTGQALGSGGTITAPVKVVLLGVIGVAIEFMAAMSFGAAAIAFVFRFVILIVLLAFSPIWFVSFISPELEQYAKKWSSMYKSMLLFMPVYLLLMYLALNVLTSSPLFGWANTAGTVGNTSWYSGLLTIGINGFIVVFLLNMPLVAAASIAGSSISILGAAAKKFSAEKVFGTIGGFAGTHTIGALAGKTDAALANTRLGNSLLGRDLRSATTGALAKSKMGGVRSHEERQKELKDVAKKSAEIVRGNTFRSTLAGVSSGSATPADLKNAMGKMTEKEILAAGTAKLKDSNMLRYMKKSHLDAIKKSDEISEDDKKDILSARKAAFEAAVTGGNSDVVKDMLKAYDGPDLLESSAVLDNPTILPYYTTGQLKAIDDASNDPVLKQRIGNAIIAAAAGTRIPTEGWINKQRADFNTWM